jgi:large subunit ribosomal protein L25
VYTPDAHTAVIELEDGNKIDAIIQDIQFHPVNEKILHIDFFQVFDDKEVKMIIPVKFEGNSPGVRLQGGILSKNKRKLFVKALPKNLPDFIKADISTLNLNDKITIEDLQDENYSFIHPENMVVCQVKMSRASMSLETETDEEEGEEGEEGSSESESKPDGSAESNETKENKKEGS